MIELDINEFVCPTYESKYREELFDIVKYTIRKKIPSELFLEDNIRQQMYKDDIAQHITYDLELFLISKNKEVEKFNKTTKSEIAKKLSNKILHALIQ
jgi:hypothetical protein